MNREQRFWYLDELVTQGIAAKLAFQALEMHLSNEQTKHSLLVWSSISSFLAHTAAISKILFPPRNNGRDRATELIEILQIPELTELRNRSGRDNVEHMDERIDNWAARDANHVISMVIPNREGYDYLCTPDKAVRRVLIQEDLIYVSENSQGHRVETLLGELLRESVIVLDSAHQQMLRDPPYHFLLVVALANYAR